MPNSTTRNAWNATFAVTASIDLPSPFHGWKLCLIAVAGCLMLVITGCSRVSACGLQKDFHRRGSMKLSLNRRHPIRIVDDGGELVCDRSAAIADFCFSPV